MEKSIRFKAFTWLVVLFFVLCMPNAFKQSSQIQTTCIVVGFGIDKSDVGFEVSAQVVIPQAGGEYSQTQEIISDKGISLSEAVSNLELKTGKKLGLAHCHVLVLSKELCLENIMPHIDYLLRSDLMDNNSVLLYTNQTAKQLLKASSQINTSDLNNLQNITSFNTKQEASSRISLIDFVNDFLNPTKLSIVSSIDAPSEQQSSGSSSQNSLNQSPNSTSSTSEEASTLLNDGSSVVFHDGAVVLELEKQQTHCINWLNIKSQNGVIEISNVNDSSLKLNKAQISYSVCKKTLNFFCSIVDNCPVLNVEINLDLTVNQVVDEKKQVVASGQNLINDNINQKIQNLVEGEIEQALTLCKQNKIDLFRAYNIFNKTINAQWQNYVKSLENQSDYLNNLKIFVKTNSKLRN